MSEDEFVTRPIGGLVDLEQQPSEDYWSELHSRIMRREAGLQLSVFMAAALTEALPAFADLYLGTCWLLIAPQEEPR